MMLTNVFIGNINKKVSINFIIEGTSYIVKINRGSSISKDIIPLSNKNYVVKLYYDEEDKIEYNNEGVKEGTTIFVDTNISLESAKPVGQILTLQEAYNKNILTKEDLYQIQNNINDYCYGDTYMNIIKGIYTCEWISEDLIRQNVYDKESQLNPACEGCLEFEVIKKYFIYFGTYNDCIVFRAEGCGSYIGTDWGANINIDGSIIHLPEGPNLYVWKPVETSN